MQHNLHDLATRLKHSSSNPSAVETIAAELHAAAEPPKPEPAKELLPSARPDSGSAVPADVPEATVEDRTLKLQPAVKHHPAHPAHSAASKSKR